MADARTILKDLEKFWLRKVRKSIPDWDPLSHSVHADMIQPGKRGQTLWMKADGIQLSLSIDDDPEMPGFLIIAEDVELPKDLQRQGIYSGGIRYILVKYFRDMSKRLWVHAPWNHNAFRRIAQKLDLEWINDPQEPTIEGITDSLLGTSADA